MIAEAKAEGNEAAVRTFTYANEVEKVHAALYQKAIDNLGKAAEAVDYYVCSVCGYTCEKEAPEECPVCKAKKKVFMKVLNFPAVGGKIIEGKEDDVSLKNRRRIIAGDFFQNFLSDGTRQRSFIPEFISVAAAAAEPFFNLHGGPRSKPHANAIPRSFKASGDRPKNRSRKGR